MELNQELAALIKQHLPQMAANNLAEFIEQANKDSAALEQVTKKLANTEETLKDYREKASTVEQARRLVVERGEALDLRDKKLYDAELKLDRAQNKLVADVALAELNGVKETMSMFLRNITVRTNVTESIGIPVTGTSGGNGYGGGPGYVADKTQTRFTTEDKE